MDQCKTDQSFSVGAPCERADTTRVCGGLRRLGAKRILAELLGDRASLFGLFEARVWRRVDVRVETEEHFLLFRLDAS